MVVKNNGGMNNRRRTAQSIDAWAAAKVALILKVSEQRATAMNDVLYWVQDWQGWLDVLAHSDLYGDDMDDWDDEDDDDFFDVR